jgi:hypothetical protein
VIRAGAAVVLLALLSMIGSALLPSAIRPAKAVLALSLSLSLGASTVGLLVWTCGSWVGTWSALPLVGALWVLSLSRASRWGKDVRRMGRLVLALMRSSPFGSLLLSLPLVASMPALLAPLSDSDGIRYHVAHPKLFVLTGHVFFYPWDVTGAFPQAAEMLYLVGLELAGGDTAKFLHFGFFLASLTVLALLVYRGRDMRGAALIAPFLFAASPVAAAIAPYGFIDHVALFHLATAVLLLSRRARPVLVGLALGGALATKLTAGPAILGLLVVLVLRTPGRARLRALVAASLPVVVAFAPFAIRNVVRTGDPIFPVGYGLLGKPIPGVSAESARHTLSYNAGLSGPLPIAWTFEEGKVQTDEVAGPHHLLGLAALAIAFLMPAGRVLIGLILPYLAVALLARPPTRYLMPMFMAFSALEAWALSHFMRRFALPLAALVAAPALVLSIQILWGDFSSPDYFLGRMSREEFLARKVPGWRAAAFVNTLPPGGQVMALDFPSPYTFDRPWIVEGVLNDPPLKSWLREEPTAERVLARLQALNVRYLVVTPGYGGGTKVSLYPLATSRPAALRVIELRKRLKLLTTIDRVDVYEVPAAR